MLTDFRRVFPEAPLTSVDTERGCTNADAGAILDVPVTDLAGVVGCCRPDDFRVFATGSAGRAIVGGPLEGLGGFGSAVVMFVT